MRHSMSKDSAFNGETTPRCNVSQCLPPGYPIILCAKHGSPIIGKSFIPKISPSMYKPLQIKAPRNRNAKNPPLNRPSE